jgi:hypothetical protein
MDAAIVVAFIALAGAIGNVALTYFLNARSERRRARQRADAVWDRYRTSLAFSAEELADRIDNILENAFLDAYGDRTSYRDEAVVSTLFRFCQYFGWSEILRRLMRTPDARHATEVKTLAEFQGVVGRAFATDRFGTDAFMIWREAQRAVGELMVTHDGEITDTVGVAGFLSDYEKFRPWLHRMEYVMTSAERRRGLEQARARLEAVRAALRVLAAELAKSAPVTR